MADIGRRLAAAMSQAGYSRDIGDRKAAAELATELCRLWREDQREHARVIEPGLSTGT
jgi:hypothetical protein